MRNPNKFEAIDIAIQELSYKITNAISPIFKPVLNAMLKIEKALKKKDKK